MKTHPQFLAKMQRREKSFFEKDILFPEFCSFFDIVKKDKKGKGMKGFSKTGHLKNLIKFEKKNHFFGKCSISKNIRFFFLTIYPKSFHYTKKWDEFSKSGQFIFFANNYPKWFILAKKWNVFSKTGHLKNLIKFGEKIIFSASVPPQKKSEFFS